MNIKWFASLTFLVLIESSKSESQDIRVKLCGREFIRMVVTSCGSSRFKRNAPDSGPLYTTPISRFTFSGIHLALNVFIYNILSITAPSDF